MKKIWFPAKRYGWGWGLPNCWQGWLVLAVFVGLVAACAVWLPQHPFLYAGALLVLSLLLVGVCWLKGEKPKWRWGGKDEGED